MTTYTCTDACPWPHEVCEYSLCETCGECPEAIALRERLKAESAARMRAPLRVALAQRT